MTANARGGFLMLCFFMLGYAVSRSEWFISILIVGTIVLIVTTTPTEDP